jgi:RES domain-containing protein
MIPASVRVATVSIDKPPANRFIASPPPELQVLGGDWLERGTTAVLKVPSVIVTEEWNYPLNPLHADFLKLRISAPQPFNFSSSPRQGARLGTTGHSTI